MEHRSLTVRVSVCVPVITLEVQITMKTVMRGMPLQFILTSFVLFDRHKWNGHNDLEIFENASDKPVLNVRTRNAYK